MSKQKVLLELEIPCGYEATGEYRRPRKGEWFLGANGEASYARDDLIFAYPILRKTWQPPAWIPDGYWLYKSGNEWYVSEPDDVPVAARYSDGFGANSPVAKVMSLIGCPAPSRIQVKRHG